MGNSNVTWCLECHSYKDSATHASLWLNTIVRLTTSQLVSLHHDADDDDDDDDDEDDEDDEDDDDNDDNDYSGREQHACANSSDISLASAKGCFFASHDLQAVQLGGS